MLEVGLGRPTSPLLYYQGIKLDRDPADGDLLCRPGNEDDFVAIFPLPFIRGRANYQGKCLLIGYELMLANKLLKESFSL